MLKLTPKQQRFIEQYLIDLNGTQAAIRAGYAPKRADAIAFENLRKPVIKAAIQAARQKQSETSWLTREYVLDGLKREAESVAEESSHAARVRALELLGKHLGMFTERHEVLERKVVIEFTDEDIDADRHD